ncbi:MAG: GAF domain-containing protein [Magnetococcales bacterium]|nr:GAF domain-containing protein [Magnetococcales bacterium]
MDFDTFQTEQSVIEAGDLLLTDKGVKDFQGPFKTLLKDYKKLFKVSRRLVRMSDRSEEGLKKANDKIQAQQLELEKAHQKLGQHAETLEEKVQARTQELVATQGKLERLVDLGIALSQERNQARFMEMILQGAKELTHADGGILFIRDEKDFLHHEIISIDTLERHQGGTTGQDINTPPIPMRSAKSGKPDYFNLAAHTAFTERTVNITNSYDNNDFDFSDLHNLNPEGDYRSTSLLAVPLKPRQGDVSGVLLLINARKPGTGRVLPFSSDMTKFVEALTAQAAVALDNKNLVEAQVNLLNSIIKLTASAIDAKSPYTGGHCERVPEIGTLLAQAACDEDDGIFGSFDMNQSEWDEFRLAAWLHDCGKVTTPEYVVDKATKLETIYNRIHEVRTRFEVLRRDCVINYQKALIEGLDDPDLLKKDLEAAIARLEEEYAFIAECNVGGEFMAEEKIKRLEQIGAQTWERYFDDRLGLSYGELTRLERIPKRRLPAKEALLTDKKDHIFRHPKGEDTSYLETFNIKLKPPRYLYNAGELYNLRIARGTLTEEERFKIMEHSIQTIIMLEQLPFPKHLSHVPEFAGGHHETMIGTGYPRKLKKEDMSVQARILAIADIFEALTAADRPYKKPKTINEALRILSFMRNDQHIDADLFDLFLTSGVYQTYAEIYLGPDQIDEVDIKQFLSKKVGAEEV